MAKKKWPILGTIRKNKDNRSYIKLADNITILVDGEEIELNEYRTVQLQSPADNVKRLFENDIIDEAEYDRRLEKLAENSWLKYELVVPPAR